MEGGSSNAPTFVMYVNGIPWKIKFTDSNEDLYLRGAKRLGIADRRKHTIYLDDSLQGDLLKKVLLHELTHAWLFSYGYNMSVEDEEFISSFVDTHAEDILERAESVLKDL